MKIGILGAGNVGGALGLSWTRAGHSVMFGVRNPASDELKAVLARSDGKATAGSALQASQFGDVIVNALPWPATKETLAGLELSGKIVLDCSNPLLPGLAGIEVGTTSSGGELVAAWAAGAKVVKIFNTTGYGNMENPVYKGTALPMFYCSDHPEAKDIAASLARDTGFQPVDAGPLSNSRLLEPHAMLWIWLAVKGGWGRDFAFQLARR